MSPAGPSRKQARRDAVFLLYQTEVTDLPMADLVKGQKLREGYAPDDFTIKAVAGVLRDKEALDAELEAHSRGWPLDRVAPLERSILRLALWEIRSEVSPPEVAIDEAVRLAKRYSTDEAGAFVNGVLGGCLRGTEDAASAGDEDETPERGAGESRRSLKTGRRKMADEQIAGLALTREQALARLKDILTQLEELEPRLAASSSAEVEMTLLERATEQVEEAGRLLEQLGRVTG